MKTSEDIFNEKAHFNLWLKELNMYEQSLIREMINEGMEEAIKECKSIISDYDTDSEAKSRMNNIINELR